MDGVVYFRLSLTSEIYSLKIMRGGEVFGNGRKFLIAKSCWKVNSDSSIYRIDGWRFRKAEMMRLSHLRFLGGNTMHGESSLHVVDQTEVLADLVDCDDIWKQISNDQSTRRATQIFNHPYIYFSSSRNPDFTIDHLLKTTIEKCTLPYRLFVRPGNRGNARNHAF